MAPILPATNEEGLDAHLPSVAGKREDVGVAEPLGMNRLAALNIGQRTQPIAVDRGEFKILRLGGVRHRFAEPRLNPGGFAGEKLLRILDQLGIGRLFDPPDAGGRATADLIKQTRPRTVSKKTV